MSACRECGAPLEWAITDNGRKMPLDLGAFTDGRLVVVGRLEGAPLVVSLTGDQLARLGSATTLRGAKVELRRSHFQTCSKPERFRRQ